MNGGGAKENASLAVKCRAARNALKLSEDVFAEYAMTDGETIKNIERGFVPRDAQICKLIETVFRNVCG